MTAIERPSTNLDVLREKLAPDASDKDLEWLGAVSQRLGLDPIAGHIVLIGRYDGRLRRNVYRPQVTAEGRLVVAERTGELVAIDGPQWCGPRNEAGGHDWLEVWDDPEPPHAARCFVQRKGWTRPVNGTVRWAEFAQTDGQGRLLPTWRAMPSHMLGKTALSLALRRQFPGLIPAEIDEADREEDVGPVTARPEQQPSSPTPAGPPMTDGQKSVIYYRLQRLSEQQREQVREMAMLSQLPPVKDAPAGVGLAYHGLITDVEMAGTEGEAGDGDFPDPEADPVPEEVHDATPEASDGELGTPKYDPADNDPGRPM
ncbi:MAG: recombinase RecT [Acidimicrobiaceae bacterium]|nr:recombinase RecT [Acidimicrobiaceae bacterium]